MSAPSTPSTTQRGEIIYVLKVSLPLVACLIATSLMTYVLYSSTQQQFRWGVDERLLGLASVAAVQFDPAELDQITGPESVGTTIYRQTIFQLQIIRRQTGKIRFAYILRRTDDPFTYEFVADADSLDPSIPIDLNGDGIIDDRDALAWPGDSYDVRDFPEFRAAAFVRPFVDPDLTHDQWGTFLAGTAPIRNNSNSAEPARYVLGLDMDVSDFESLTQRLFLPFVLFAIFIVAIVTGLTFWLNAVWRRQLLQLQELDRQKDELIGVVGHQLNSPVSTLRISLEEILRGTFGPLKGSLREPLGHLLQSAANLAELTTLLLDVSRIELGKLGVDRQETDLEPFLASIIEQAAAQAKQKGVRFHAESPPRRAQALLDRRLTRIALDNLLSNAIKYTPTGGEVTFAAQIQGNQLHCRIADSGIGIPAEDQALLFTKLFRASNARAVPGNGFGLYVTKGAIEQQGGRLTFTSHEGKGTTFLFDLPINGVSDNH